MDQTTNDVTDALADVQGRALADQKLSIPAKLMLCRLMCGQGFRSGWIVSDSRWSPEDVAALGELEGSGYVTIRRDGAAIGVLLSLPSRE